MEERSLSPEEEAQANALLDRVGVEAPDSENVSEFLLFSLAVLKIMDDKFTREESDLVQAYLDGGFSPELAVSLAGFRGELPPDEFEVDENGNPIEFQWQT